MACRGAGGAWATPYPQAPPLPPRRNGRPGARRPPCLCSRLQDPEGLFKSGPQEGLINRKIFMQQAAGDKDFEAKMAQFAEKERLDLQKKREVGAGAALLLLAVEGCAASSRGRAGAPPAACAHAAAAAVARPPQRFAPSSLFKTKHLHCCGRRRRAGTQGARGDGGPGGVLFGHRGS